MSPALRFAEIPQTPSPSSISAAAGGAAPVLVQDPSWHVGSLLRQVGYSLPPGAAQHVAHGGRPGNSPLESSAPLVVCPLTGMLLPATSDAPTTGTPAPCKADSAAEAKLAAISPYRWANGR